MKITVKESTMVTPAEATPTTCLWLSNLDLVIADSCHVRCAYFYRSTNNDDTRSSTKADFFDLALLKVALSETLVPFYPVAGRLKKSDNGRLEIDCNGKGVLFVEAESDGVMDELGDFNPRLDLNLIPRVDYSGGVSTYPIFLVQVTRFKCGGVCLATAIEHHTVDGVSGLHFINSWSERARGLHKVTIPPFFDKKAVLFARDPPEPKFMHIEFQPFPSMILPREHGAIVYKKFRLTRAQMNALMERCKDNVTGTRYSTFEVLAGHAWRCACIARGLPDNQETRLQFPVDGRARLLQPPVPPGYFGNVIFQAALVLSAGEVQSNPFEFLVPKIREAIARMDDEYLRSAIDYLELVPDLVSLSRSLSNRKCPNLGIVSWDRLPLYDANFGWGWPIYVGNAAVPPEGISSVLPTKDGSILYGISLPGDEMGLFEKLFHDV